MTGTTGEIERTMTISSGDTHLLALVDKLFQYAMIRWYRVWTLTVRQRGPWTLLDCQGWASNREGRALWRCA
jgi:hypothetical protein